MMMIYNMFVQRILRYNNQKAFAALEEVLSLMDDNVRFQSPTTGRLVRTRRTLEPFRDNRER